MRLSRLLALVVIVAAMTALAGCGDDSSPTSPSGPTATQTFQGTLATNGAATHTFVSNTSGTVTATLNTLTTESGALAPAVGISLGTFALNSCAAAVSNDLAFSGTVITGSVAGAVSLCVRVYDAAGRIAEPVSYSITVAYP